MGASAGAGEDGAPFPHGTVLRVVVPKSALPLSAPSLRCRGQLLVSDLQLEIPVTSREDPEAAQTSPPSPAAGSPRPRSTTLRTPFPDSAVHCTLGTRRGRHGRHRPPITSPP